MKLKIAVATVVLLAAGATAYSLLIRRCDDRDKVYKICSDQETVYRSSLDTAAASQKFVLVSFGADWCPWCQAIHKYLDSVEFRQEFEEALLVNEIGVYRYDSRDKIPSGVAVLKEVLTANGKTIEAVDGYPFLTVVRPSDKKAVLIPTGDLEDNSKGKGHDRAKVRAALASAIVQLKTQ